MKNIFNNLLNKMSSKKKSNYTTDQCENIPIGYNVSRWVTFFNHLKNSKNYYPDICVDVGAGSGTGVIYEAFRKSKHYVFEPVEENIKLLHKRLRKYKYELFPYCVSDEVREVNFYKSKQNILTSTIIDDYVHKDTIKFMSEKITTKTLNDILKNKILSNNNLIKIDVQGSDLKVLIGASEIIDKFEIIIIECSIYNFSMSKNKPTINNVVNFLDKSNFSLINILSGINRPYDNTLAQLDLVFARNDSKLFSYHEWI